MTFGQVVLAVAAGNLLSSLVGVIVRGNAEIQERKLIVAFIEEMARASRAKTKEKEG